MLHSNGFNEYYVRYRYQMMLKEHDNPSIITKVNNGATAKISDK
jgi:hypothetical protein